MPYIYQKTDSDLYLALQERFKRAGLISESPDSLTNIINEFITEELYKLSIEFDNKINDYSISNASGDALDSLAEEMYGLTRFQATKAVSYDNIEITNPSADIEITIPKGTFLSGGLAFSENSIIYETLEEYTVSSESSILASAIAIIAGSDYNVEENYLTNINLTSSSSLIVTNLYPIINGRDQETDDNFRFRLANYISSITSQNIDYLKLNLLEVPGVFNLKFAQGYNGLGTMSVFATTSSGRTNPELKDLITGRISEIATPGELISFEEGFRAVFDITIKLVNNNAYSQDEIDRLKYNIRVLIAEELVSAKANNLIRFSVLEDTIKRSLRDRYSFVIDGSTSIFTRILCRYIGANDPLLGSRPNLNLDVSSGAPDLTLNIDEVPEIGNIDIEVSLTL